jgi:hypothetical protein
LKATQQIHRHRHRQSAKFVYKGTEGRRTEPENRKKTENANLDLGQPSKGRVGVPVQADHDGEENQGDDRHCEGEEVGDICIQRIQSSEQENILARRMRRLTEELLELVDPGSERQHDNVHKKNKHYVQI